MPRRRISDRLLVWEVPGVAPSSTSASPAAEDGEEPNDVGLDEHPEKASSSPAPSGTESHDEDMEDYDAFGDGGDDDILSGVDGEEDDGDSDVELLFDEVNDTTQLCPLYSNTK